MYLLPCLSYEKFIYLGFCFIWARIRDTFHKTRTFKSLFKCLISIQFLTQQSEFPKLLNNTKLVLGYYFTVEYLQINFFHTIFNLIYKLRTRSHNDYASHTQTLTLGKIILYVILT